MVIRYKIVRSNRRSYIVSEQSKHSLVYTKGTIVKENKKGLGIMCFETREQASKFITCGESYKIIKVRPIGRGRKVKKVAYVFKNVMLEKCILGFFNKSIPPRTSPFGTICYDSVEVLN